MANYLLALFVILVNLSIEASVYPTENDYLYFVADKKGEIYYTKSQSEHLAKVKELKEAGLWIW